MAEMKFHPDFKPKEFTIILQKNEREAVAMYINEFKGKNYYHMRTVYLNSAGEWCPGQGFSVQASLQDDLLSGLLDMMDERGYVRRKDK